MIPPRGDQKKVEQMTGTKTLPLVAKSDAKSDTKEGNKEQAIGFVKDKVQDKVTEVVGAVIEGTPLGNPNSNSVAVASSTFDVQHCLQVSYRLLPMQLTAKRKISHQVCYFLERKS